MTLNEYIENLKEFIKENPGAGELEVYACSDDEGNDCNKVVFTPSKSYIDSDGERYSVEDLDEYEADELSAIVIIN